MDRSPLICCIALACLLSTNQTLAQPQDLVDPETAALLVDLVRAAAEYDLYFARCRGDVSGRRLDKVKKVLIGRYGISVTQVQDDYFPERSYQRARKSIEQDFRQELSRLGGCKGAKEKGFRDELRSRYRDLLDRLQQLP